MSDPVQIRAWAEPPILNVNRYDLVGAALEYADVLERFLLVRKDAPSLTLRRFGASGFSTDGYNKPAGRYVLVDEEE